MVNQMGKCIPRLVEINKPLCQLLHKDIAWLCSQETAFQQVKDMFASPEILAHYDSDCPTVIAADAFSDGTGAVLLEIQDDGRRRPVCNAPRSLTETEKRCAVTEKEALENNRASQDATSHPTVSNETDAIQPESRIRTRKATNDT